MAEALDKILRLAGAPVPHGSDVAHNAAIGAVMSDKSGSANHSMRGGIVVHSVKDSDAAIVMSHHESHPVGAAATPKPAVQPGAGRAPGHMPGGGNPHRVGLTASMDGGPTDGLVMHGMLRKSELGRGESAVEKVRGMVEGSPEEEAKETPAQEAKEKAEGKDKKPEKKEAKK